MPPKEWGEGIQSSLEKIHYQHLRGEIIEEKILKLTAVVVLRAIIVAIDGISTQTEIYTLCFDYSNQS